MRWVGIDEAGYGPNLGPLVMTAVIAGSPRDTGDDGSGRHNARFLVGPRGHSRSRRRRPRPALG